MSNRPAFRFRGGGSGGLSFPVPTSSVGWRTNTGSYGDGGHSGDAVLKDRAVHGVSIFADHWNTDLYTTTGRSYLGFLESYGWSTFTEVGDLIISSQGGFALNKLTGEPAWAYESSTGRPPVVHAQYDISQNIVNEDYCFFFDDLQGNTTPFVLLNSQTGDVLYEGALQEFGSNWFSYWPYYTNFYQLKDNNKVLAIVDARYNAPYKDAYIMTFGPTGLVALDPHPHTSGPAYTGKELFGSPYNWSPYVHFLLDKSDGSYYYFNTIEGAANGVISKFSVSNDLIWSFGMPAPIDGVFYASRMSVANGRLIVIGNTPSAPIFSINAITGDDYVVDNGAWHGGSYGGSLTPKTVTSDTSLPFAFGTLGNHFSTTAPIGIAVFDTVTLSVTVTVPSLNDVIGESVSWDFLSTPYYGVLQRDGAGDYFFIARTLSGNAHSRLVKITKDGLIKSISVLDAGTPFNSPSISYSLFSDGELYMHGTNPNVIARTGPPETANRTKWVPNVPLIKDKWYSPATPEWNAGRMFPGGRFEGRQIARSSELSGGRFIPLTSNRFLNIDTGFTHFMSTITDNVYISIHQWDSDHWVLGTSNSTLPAQLFNIHDGTAANYPVSNPTGIPTGYTRREYRRRPNGNLLAVYARNSGEARVQLYEWVDGAWVTLALTSGLFSLAAANNTFMYFDDRFLVVNWVMGGTTNVYEYSFGLNSWSLLHSIATPALTTGYGMSDKIGASNPALRYTHSNAGVMYLANTLQYNALTGVISEFPIDKAGDLSLTKHDPSTATFNLGANLIVYEGILFRIEDAGMQTSTIRARPLSDGLSSPEAETS
jgi:hypothetical protein